MPVINIKALKNIVQNIVCETKTYYLSVFVQKDNLASVE